MKDLEKLKDEIRKIKNSNRAQHFKIKEVLLEIVEVLGEVTDSRRGGTDSIKYIPAPEPDILKLDIGEPEAPKKSYYTKKGN
uniref:Uncharacterized protein n=1 Tax=viral metagenome TaxID=1070528 RepID=A0A6M3IR19_9ZZZZ